MRSYLLILWGCLALCFSSCTEQKGYNPPTFPVEKETTGHCIADELLISYAYDMAVDDKYIYVLALADNTWVQVYDKKNGEHLGGYVPQGQGPEEVSTGAAFTLCPEKSTLSIYDQAQRKSVIYAIRPEEASSLLSYAGSFSFASCQGAVRRAWPTGSQYVTDGQLGEQDGTQKRFQLYDGEKVLAAYNEFPVPSKEQQAAFLSPQVCFSPSFEKMATGTLYGGVLETFRLSERTIEPTGLYPFYEPDAVLQSGVITPQKGMKYGFSALCASEEHIYSVLIGDEDPNRLNDISVFDWNGQGVARYHTDKLVFKVAYTPSDPEQLYALTFEPESGFHLYAFPL